MAQTALAQILERMDGLDRNELEGLQEAVRQRLSPSCATTPRESFHRALQSAGLVPEFKTRDLAGARPSLVCADGRPVSETVIEERR